MQKQVALALDFTLDMRNHASLSKGLEMAVVCRT